MLVLTWNCQGGDKWSDLATLIKKHRPDVVCVQECGRHAGFVGREDLGSGTSYTCIQYGTSHNQNAYGFAWYEFGTSNKRCNLGIMWRVAQFDLQFKPRLFTVNAEQDGLRPLVGVEYGDVWAYSIHAPSSNHSFSRKIATQLLAQVPDKKWFVAGDFNCTPEEIVGGADWDGSWKFGKSGKSTQKSGSELDYVVCSDTLSATFKEYGNNTSDHYPLLIEVN